MFRILFFAFSLGLVACHGAQDPSSRPPSRGEGGVTSESFPLPLGKGSGDGPTALPYYNSPDFSPQFLANPDSVRKVIDHRIGAFSFSDQDGRIIGNRSVAGRIHVANFMFTSCGSICPIMTGELHKVARAFRGDSSVLLLSYSVTPWIDSRSRLQQYRQRNGIDSFPQWHFLTGDKGRIYSLARQSYFAEEAIGYSRDSSEFLHTEHLLLVDGSGRLRGIYNGTLALETEQLIADIRALQAETKAPVHKAGTL